MCDCDLETPEIFYEKCRTARRNHICCECRSEIQPGDRYVFVKGLWDGEWSEYKVCPDCNAVASLYAVQGGCYCLGELYQSLIDEDLLSGEKENRVSLAPWLVVVKSHPIKCLVAAF